MNAYQSYLWNECVKEIVKEGVEKKKLYSVEYGIGALLFYTNLTKPERENIPQTFQTISETMLFSEGEQRIVGHVLAKENLSLADFAIENETGNFFKTRARQILLIPEGCTISEPQRDEINSKANRIRYKIQVEFSLPKGSYATLVTKRIFNH